VIEVRGAEQLAELSQRLREAAENDLQRELSRGFARPGSNETPNDPASFVH
jgi:hypothetical protein